MKKGDKSWEDDESLTPFLHVLLTGGHWTLVSPPATRASEISWRIMDVQGRETLLGLITAKNKSSSHFFLHENNFLNINKYHSFSIEVSRETFQLQNCEITNFSS